MDKSLRRNVILGVFVLVGAALFVTGIFFIGSKSEMFSKTFPISARFNNATGLKPGSNVRYNGVKVGIVRSVKLINDTLVQVDMNIEAAKRVFILTDAIASIVSDGLMGDKLVNITAGKGDGGPIHDHDFICSRNALVTDQMLETLNRSNENIRVITDNLKTLTSEINANNGTAQMLYRDTTMAHNLKQSFSNLDAITQKVLKVSGSLQEVSSKLDHGDGTISQLLNDTALAHNLSLTMDNLKETSDELIRASGSLSRTVEKANSGKGAINMLLTDSTLTTNIQQSMTNIKKASVGLNENMEALKHNFLTRGYFRKEARKARKAGREQAR